MPGFSRNTLPMEIAKLSNLDHAQLLELWQQKIGVPPQFGSAELTRRWLAWELQARVRGGLDLTTRRRLRQLGGMLRKQPATSLGGGSSLKPGTVLSRKWKGINHQVVVLDQCFSWNGESCTSLSNIAFRITGTRWSGPRFFGLTKIKAKP